MKHVKKFASQAKVVNWHIPSKHGTEMATKSYVVRDCSLIHIFLCAMHIYNCTNNAGSSRC